MYGEMKVFPALDPFAECAWASTPDPGGSKQPQRVLPEGCGDLVLTLGESLDILGPAKSYRLVAGQKGFVGIRFRRGMAGALLRIRTNELAGRSVALRDAVGSFGRQLENRLIDETGPIVALQILQQALAGRVTGAEGHDAAVLASVERLRRFPNIKMSRLTDASGLSERQLRRRFQDAVGLSVKRLGRIIRFQQMVDELRVRRRRLDSISWARLACDYGYSDQAHLIRETVELAGVTPTQLI